jgi:hypothetical protein
MPGNYVRCPLFREAPRRSAEGHESGCFLRGHSAIHPSTFWEPETLQLIGHLEGLSLTRIEAEKRDAKDNGSLRLNGAYTRASSA